jgi:hypothetical protein
MCCFTNSDVTSDQSDLENRIQALTEKLKKCKAEAESLRREQRKQRKMKLKAEEESLKQQIEVTVLLFNVQAFH